MPIEVLPGGSMVFTGTGIDLFRMATLRSALKLEIKGIKVHRGRSAYSIIKKEFNLKGNRTRVLEQFSAMVDEFATQVEVVKTATAALAPITGGSDGEPTT